MDNKMAIEDYLERARIYNQFFRTAEKQSEKSSSLL